MAAKIFLAVFVLAVVSSSPSEAKKVNFVHWNHASPMFRIDNTDHIVDVEEYDQVNLICPVSKPGTRYPERHVIYSVSKEEYDSCRITNPKPRIVAICNRPHRLMYFTITFRSFTPTPGGMEFRPGQDYFFISTSSKEDLHRRVGGGCSTHNMKMIFKVHTSSRIAEDLEDQLQTIQVPSAVRPTTTTTTERPHVNSKTGGGGDGYSYYYHPRDVVALEKAFDEITGHQHGQEEVVKNALRFTYSSSPTSSASRGLSLNSTIVPTLLLLLLLSAKMLSWTSS